MPKDTGEYVAEMQLSYDIARYCAGRFFDGKAVQLRCRKELLEACTRACKLLAVKYKVANDAYGSTVKEDFDLLSTTQPRHNAMVTLYNACHPDTDFGLAYINTGDAETAYSQLRKYLLATKEIVNEAIEFERSVREGSNE